MKFFIALFIMLWLTMTYVLAQSNYVVHLRFDTSFQAQNQNGVVVRMSSGYYQLSDEDQYYVYFIYQKKVYKTRRWLVDGRIKKLKVYNNYHSL